MPKRMNAGATAATAVRRWKLLHSRLAPIIGDDGFRLLFARSLHRARITHPWLARVEVLGDVVPFATLKTSLESQRSEIAADASRALVDHFNELLNALIGEELATRLIGPI